MYLLHLGNDSLWIYLTWNTMGFLDLIAVLFPRLGKFLMIISSNKLYDPSLSLSFFKPYNMIIGLPDVFFKFFKLSSLIFILLLSSSSPPSSSLFSR